jgi:VCBS repeat-containing protein
LNDDGTAVATVGLLDPNVPQGFRDVIVWQNGVPSFLPPVPENLLAGCSEVRGRRPFGINRAGHIFGKSGGFELPGGNSCDRYWIYKNGAFEMLPLRDPDGSPGVCELTYAPYEGASGDRLNDSDHVVVQRTRIAFNASSNCLPFPEFAGILAGTSFTPIAEAFAFQINNHDQLLLFTLDPNGRARSHLWNGSMLVDLGIDAGGYSLNNLGQLTFKIIVGAECPLRMYSNGTVTDVPLPSDLSYLNLACHSTFLNDAGQIVLSPSGGPERAVLLTPTGGPNLDVTAPVLTNIPSNQTLVATSSAGAIVSWSPLTADDDRDGPVPVVCSPSSGSVFPIGVTTVTCTATDVTGNLGSGSFTVTVLGTAPIAQNSTITTDEDTAFNGTLIASAAEGAALTFSLVTPPAFGSLVITNPSTGAFTYTPALNRSGGDSFTFQVTAAGAVSNIATVSINITAANDAPVAFDGTSESSEDGLAIGPLLVSDPDSLVVQFEVVSQPAHGTVFNLNPVATPLGGSFEYIPHANYNGVDSFTFRAVDGDLNSNVATITITVTPVNDAPDLSLAVVTMQEGVAGSGKLFATDVDDVAFTFAIDSPPTKGTVTITDTTTGAFTYTPNAGQVGYDAFTFRATDAGGASSTATGMAFIVAASPSWPGQTVRAGAGEGPQSRSEYIGVWSTDHRFFAFIQRSGDENADLDVFVSDEQTGELTRVTRNGNGDSSQPVLNGDGRFVAFVSQASNFVAGDTNLAQDVFVFDRQGGRKTRVSVASDGTQADRGSTNPKLSADGRYVAFTSFATNLVAGDTNGVADVFVHDRQTGVTTRVSVASDGTQGDGASQGAVISADGRYVVFGSDASNLIAGDTNGVADVFVHDRQTGVTTRVSVANDGSESNGASAVRKLSEDGRFVAFASVASNLAPDDPNDTLHVFVVGGVTVSPTSVNLDSAGGSRTVGVTFDYPGTPWTATTTTPWITINQPIGGSANGTVNFTVAPNAGPARTGTLVVALQTVKVTQDASAPPVAQNGAVTVAEDGSAVGTLSAIDPNGDAITFSLLTPPAHGTAVLTNSSTGAFTYTPPANYNGPDSFTFTATGGGETSNTATIAVTVTPVNDPPTAQNGSNSVFTGASVSGTLVATDIDSPSLTYAIVANGTKGTAVVTNAATGAYNYTANAGAGGTDTFTFRANDGSLNSADATVTVTIATNRPPTASNSGSLTTQEDKSGSGTLSATDPDGNRLTFIIVSNGSKGTATITNASMGRFSYVPSPNANGTDTFSFKANDGLADSNVATVTVTITAVNDAPVAADASYTITRNTALTATVTVTDVDGDQLTYSIGKAPRRGTITNFNAATGFFTYTPLTPFVGTDSFTVKVSDGKASATATISVTVN